MKRTVIVMAFVAILISTLTITGCKQADCGDCDKTCPDCIGANCPDCNLDCPNCQDCPDCNLNCPDCNCPVEDYVDVSLAPETPEGIIHPNALAGQPLMTLNLNASAPCEIYEVEVWSEGDFYHISEIWLENQDQMLSDPHWAWGNPYIFSENFLAPEGESKLHVMGLIYEADVPGTPPPEEDLVFFARIESSCQVLGIVAPGIKGKNLQIEYAGTENYEASLDPVSPAGLMGPSGTYDLMVINTRVLAGERIVDSFAMSYNPDFQGQVSACQIKGDQVNPLANFDSFTWYNEIEDKMLLTIWVWNNEDIFIQTTEIAELIISCRVDVFSDTNQGLQLSLDGMNGRTGAEGLYYEPVYEDPANRVITSSEPLEFLWSPPLEIYVHPESPITMPAPGPFSEILKLRIQNMADFDAYLADLDIQIEYVNGGQVHACSWEWLQGGSSQSLSWVNSYTQYPWIIEMYDQVIWVSGQGDLDLTLTCDTTGTTLDGIIRVTVLSAAGSIPVNNWEMPFDGPTLSY